MSKSYDKFLENMLEIDDLNDMHADITGNAVGRPDEKVIVLNKAGFVLVCAFWQSYCEEVLFEILLRYKDGTASAVPEALRVALGNRALGDRKNLDPKAFWKFTAKGWATELQSLVTYLMGDLTRPLDTPKSGNVESVFSKYLGVTDLTSQWYWPGMSAQSARTKLDNAIKRRHRLAHRGADSTTTRKQHVTDFANHVKRLAEKTDKILTNRGYVP